MSIPKGGARESRMRVRQGVLIVSGAILVLGLGACRPEEQGRPLVLSKGVYRGQQDTVLSDEQVRELRRRGEWQKY